MEVGNCFNCTTNSVPSIGAFSQAMTLMSTILMTSSCWLSSKTKWPEDFGTSLKENGNKYLFK